MTQSEKFRSFEFYGTSVLVKSNSKELLERIEKDFYNFLVPLEEKSYDFKIDSLLESEISVKIPSWPQIRESKNSITYEKGNLRINDYFGKLVSLYDYSKDRGQLYSTDLEKLHEITYLLILSRTGKKLDLEGIHKIHAMGFVYKGVACIGVMNMGVGKSTLLWELLKDPEIELLSDDSPLINRKGEVKSFPIRLGFNSKPIDKVIDPDENLYSLQREQYGLKHLVCLKGISNPIGCNWGKVIVFEGERGDKSLRRISRLSMFWKLQRHMVIGIGLPLIFEYFWESGLRDFLKKTKIFFLRQIAAWNLVNSSEVMSFSMGKSPSENAELLKSYILGISGE